MTTSLITLYVVYVLIPYATFKATLHLTGVKWISYALAVVSIPAEIIFLPRLERIVKRFRRSDLPRR